MPVCRYTYISVYLYTYINYISIDIHMKLLLLQVGRAPQFES